MPLYRGGRRVRPVFGIRRAAINPYRTYAPSRHMGRTRWTSAQVGRRARGIARRTVRNRVGPLARAYLNARRMMPLRHQAAAMLNTPQRSAARSMGSFSAGTSRYFR